VAKLKQTGRSLRCSDDRAVAGRFENQQTIFLSFAVGALILSVLIRPRDASTIPISPHDTSDRLARVEPEQDAASAVTGQNEKCWRFTPALAASVTAKLWELAGKVKVLEDREAARGMS
jgi:hypothetical protein